jgi:hypothetical protein
MTGGSDMKKRAITANLEYEVVERIMAFQEEKGIRHFADAIEKYIEHLEKHAYPWVSTSSA